MIIAALCLFAVEQAVNQTEENLLRNPSFHEGLENWKLLPSDSMIQIAFIDNAPAAEISVPDTVPIGFPRLWQEFPAQPGDVFQGSAEVKRATGKDGHGAYLSIENIDAQGNRLGFTQSDSADIDGAWSSLRVRTQCLPGTASVRMLLLLHGHGKAFFRNASFIKVPPKPATPDVNPVTITVTQETACKEFLGFGFEDDGWFYNSENLQPNITDEDIKLREKRIRWMRPDWIRMFFWYKDWMPQEENAPFTFESENMQSHYKTLAIYERLGAAVNVVGVEWGLPDIYRNPERTANAIGELLEYLKKKKGFRCIKYWTLTNEPNLWFLQHGYSFDDFVHMHQLVKKEITKRNLDIRVVGSDETNGGTNFFRRCVQHPECFRTANVFASHRYLSVAERDLASEFFKERLELLNSMTPQKPFVVAEFGFQDSRSSHLLNPVMESYPYALWTAAFAIQGLNLGVSGYSIWCLHEVFYPGKAWMNYGLWEGKQNNWNPKPVYYAWSMFTRLTKAGNNVWRCLSSSPDTVEAVRVGNQLFWVNQREKSAQLQIEGMHINRVSVFSEKSIAENPKKYDSRMVKNNTFDVPAMSFGYAR